MTYKEREKKFKWVRESHDIREYCPLDELITTLAAIKASIPSDAEDVGANLQYETKYGYYDSVEIEGKIWVSYWKPYTPEELEERAEKAKKASKAAREAAKTKRLKKEEQDRLEYERLKAKFETTT